MLDLNKAKDVLRIDTEDTANDETIQAILDSFPAWLETHTGLSELRQRDNKVVEQLAGLWLRKMYFAFDDVRVDRAIESLLRTVSLMAVMSEKEYQDAVFTANGQYRAQDFGVDGWESVTVEIPEPVTMSRTITANGEYCCSDENTQAVGYDTVVVDVPAPELDTLVITENNKSFDADSALVYGWNAVHVAVPEPDLETLVITSPGEYSANLSGVNGWDRVVASIDAEPIVGTLNASANGLYSAKDEGLDGYEVVNINVPSSEAVLIDQTFTEAGTYNAADDGADGYRTVSVVLPESGTDWEQVYTDFFNGGLGRIIIPEGVTAIRKYLFSGCKGYGGDLVIPGSVKSIGQNAFASTLGNMGRLVFNEGLETIGNNAFDTCYCTGDVELPNSLVTIGAQAFIYSHIENVVIRKTDGLIALSSSLHPFKSGTAIASGTAFIYVPDELLSSYQSATNWSAYPNYFKPLSEYTGGAE